LLPPPNPFVFPDFEKLFSRSNAIIRNITTLHYIYTPLAELDACSTMGTKLYGTEGGMGVTIRNGIAMKRDWELRMSPDWKKQTEEGLICSYVGMGGGMTEWDEYCRILYAFVVIRNVGVVRQNSHKCDD
jgi:hypothetical protein